MAAEEEPKAPESPIDWSQYGPKPDQYEGTDSDDDEIITSQKLSAANITAVMPKFALHERLPRVSFQDYKLKVGQLADPGESFCPWQTIKKYPYVYIGNTNRERVAAKFFDHGKLEDQTWDFFYLYRSTGVDPSNPTALILIPTKQFSHFLQNINQYFHTELTIPGGANGAFQVQFDDHGTPRPRYLGRSTNKDMAAKLKASAPPSYYKLDGEPDAVGKASDRSLMAFKAKIDLMLQSQKGKKQANREKQRLERINKQQQWLHSIKRIQRYLGIRKASQETQMAAIKKGLQSSGLAWGDYDAAVQAAAAKLLPQADFNPDKLAPYDQEGSVVFICVDVEAYEKNANQITEIGVATLDTNDLKSVVPGKGGENWLGLIRPRHFRINEYKHLQNKEFVDGCADRFEFGDSEFINLKDAPHVVSTCFKPPFSDPDSKFIPEDAPKRIIILVGHDLGADITFLKKIGYDVHNLSNLQETADTASMWRYIKRDINPRNLGSILAELDITGWNLHNAGNDAVYTLQAMIKIALKHLQDREKSEKDKEQEIKDRIAESVKEATVAAWEREQGWSSGGENSDGGEPISPVPATLKKPMQSRNKPNSGLWRDNTTNQAKFWNKQNTWAENLAPTDGYAKPKSKSWGQPLPPHLRHTVNNGDDAQIAEMLMNNNIEEKPKATKGRWGTKPVAHENRSAWDAWS